MSKRRATRDQRCINCKINIRWCFCDKIHTQDTKTHVSIIMHHRERFLTSNTAHLTKRLLKNSSIHLRGHRDLPFDFELKEEFHPLFLFPHKDAHELTDEFIQKFDKPIQLIVPDGSWRQAKKFHRREKLLNKIECIKLTDIPPSEYVLRTQTSESSLCTIEAIAYAMEKIENEQTKNHLLDGFRVMNERVHISRNSEKWNDEYQY